MEARNRPAPWLPDYLPMGKQAHPTKSGPGRKAGNGVDHGRADKPGKGAAAAFVLHSNPKAKARRAVKAEIGARQYRMQRKAMSIASRVL